MSTTNKTEALSSAAHINRAVENINAGYEKIHEIIQEGYDDQRILVNAPYAFSDYGKCLSDVSCPVCGCKVAVKMKLLGTDTDGITLEYRFKNGLNRFKWCPYTIRWMLDCPRCGLRTSRCKTLKEAFEQWDNLATLHGTGETWK